jgi:hypothetical protein
MNSRNTIIMLALLTFLLSGLSVYLYFSRDNDLKKVAERIWLREQLISATCADNADFGEKCGLMSRFFLSKTYQREFKRNYCQNDSKDQCFEKGVNALIALLKKRYFAADELSMNSLDDDFQKWEYRLMASHNEKIKKQIQPEISKETRAALGLKE